jgi:thiamine kinase-like enzyme
MLMQAYLDQAIKKICPIQGISFGSLEDKKSWTIHFDESATIDEQQAAIQFMENFVWSDDLAAQETKAERDEKYKDDLSIKAGFASYKALKPDTTLSQYLDYLETL